jgi:tetratricopeptide (TPR) repeat protein
LAYLRLGQRDLAILSYNSALGIDPRLASSLYGRGVAYLGQGLVEQGAADIAAAKAIEPKIVDELSRFGVK